jgi:hypothetical protein
MKHMIKVISVALALLFLLILCSNTVTITYDKETYVEEVMQVSKSMAQYKLSGAELAEYLDSIDDEEDGIAAIFTDLSNKDFYDLVSMAFDNTIDYAGVDVEYTADIDKDGNVTVIFDKKDYQALKKAYEEAVVKALVDEHSKYGVLDVKFDAADYSKTEVISDHELGDAVKDSVMGMGWLITTQILCFPPKNTEYNVKFVVKK